MKLTLKIVLSLLAAIALCIIAEYSTLSLMTLTRIDPLPHAQKLVEEKRFAEADVYLDFFMKFAYVSSNDEIVALHKQIKDERSGIIYNSKKAIMGFITGESDENIGKIAGAISDYAVKADLRDLGKEGWKNDKEEDLEKMNPFIQKIGDHSLVLYELTDGVILDAAQQFDTPDDIATLMTAATYGKRGVKMMTQMGAASFAKTVAKDSGENKSFYKKYILAPLVYAILLPYWLLWFFVLAGIAVWLPWRRFLGEKMPSMHNRFLAYITIHRKLQTRRAAEDSTHLYGEAAQHRMKPSADCDIRRPSDKTP